MKIKVADLEPNPFRNIDKYPIDRAKLETLKISIKEKTFWDNILARPHSTKKGKYQLAYGHHRWIALKELEIKEIDIPIKEIGDATMIQIMAEENLDWSTSPSVILQTVQAAKKYIAEEVVSGSKDIRYLFNDDEKRKVTPDVLLKFLGGNWKYWVVRYATEILADDSISREALDNIPTMRHAKSFKESVKKYQTPKLVQDKLAKKITKEGIGFRDIPTVVAEFSPPIPNLKKKKQRKIKNIPNIVDYIFKCENDTDDLNRRIKAILPEIEAIAKEGRLLGRLVPGLKRLEKTISLFYIEYEGILNGKKEKTKKVASVQVLD